MLRKKLTISLKTSYIIILLVQTKLFSDPAKFLDSLAKRVRVRYVRQNKNDRPK